MAEKNLPAASASIQPKSLEPRSECIGDGDRTHIKGVRHSLAPASFEEKPAKAGTTCGFTVEQRMIPGLLGIGIERVRELRVRVCGRDVDWRIERGKIWFTAVGVGKLRAALALPGESSKLQNASSNEEKRPEGRAPLIVRRAGPAIRNKRIVEVQWEEKGEVMLLWVRENTGFRAGQRVTEYRERGVEGQFEYTGRYRRQGPRTKDQ